MQDLLPKSITAKAERPTERAQTLETDKLNKEDEEQKIFQENCLVSTFLTL